MLLLSKLRCAKLRAWGVQHGAAAQKASQKRGRSSSETDRGWDLGLRQVPAVL